VFTNGSKECLRNAKRLLEYAQLLFDKSGFGPAQSIAILAMESAGKAVTLELANLGVVTKEVVELAMTKHSLKKIVIVGMNKILLGKELINQAKEYIIKDEKSLKKLEKVIRVRDLEEKRQNGFYVQVDSQDGAVRNTPASVSQTDALLMIKQVEIYLELCTHLCEIFRDWHKNPLSTGIIMKVRIPIIKPENLVYGGHLDYDMAIVFDEA